ncbi:MAG: hypothetical protein HKN19_15125 [Halioglobus sp.]|nr:hypothetical protein [Halioglobus sp.]
MANIKLSPLHQVEYAVSDWRTSLDFFAEVFREAEVEEPFARALSNPALDIRHCGLGQTVQQVCQPLLPGLPHATEHDRVGNCVHNLCWLVDSAPTLVSNCAAAGIETLIDFPLDAIWSGLLAPENIGGDMQGYILNSRELLGFHLEFCEVPWITEPDPPLMLPAYGPQWSALGVAGANRLLAINVVVNDLEATLATLRTAFAGSLVELQAPTQMADPAARMMVVELGDVPLVYVEPMPGDSELAGILRQRGPCVYSLVVAVPDCASAIARAAALGVGSAAVPGDCRVILETRDMVAKATCQLQGFEAVGVEFSMVEVQL